MTNTFSHNYHVIDIHHCHHPPIIFHLMEQGRPGWLPIRSFHERKYSWKKTKYNPSISGKLWCGVIVMSLLSLSCFPELNIILNETLFQVFVLPSINIQPELSISKIISHVLWCPGSIATTTSSLINYLTDRLHISNIFAQILYFLPGVK